MRHIDAFCHFFPPRLFEKMSRTAGGTKDIGKRIQGVRTIYDLDARLNMMDEFDDYAEILSLGLPPLDAMTGPQAAAEFACIANDGLAELCAKHPDRFAGYVGALPMNAPEAAAKEAEKARNISVNIYANAKRSTQRSVWNSLMRHCNEKRIRRGVDVRCRWRKPDRSHQQADRCGRQARAGRQSRRLADELRHRAQ